MTSETTARGEVYLVGAGPGDPGLLTCRGRELLTRCDCVVHDYLVSAEILELVPRTAARHFVGKRGGAESCTQGQINALLVELSTRHHHIVRLKGGDPLVFGRGGEEALTLAQAGIRFEIVPGVTSGIGAPAYAGIPVTHRAASSAVAFVTGHQQAGETGELDWASFAKIETLVLYMGMHKLAHNCAQLIAHGRSPDTPAAAIQWGTYAKQKVVVGTVATLPQLAAAASLGAPAITVIGDVVRYREHIRWFDHPEWRPLWGRRIVVTRAREQTTDLAGDLRRLGAEVISCPLARYVAAEPAALDAALMHVTQFQWLGFTSANAVHFTVERLRALGRDARALAGVRLAAVGPATARALWDHGWRADLTPAVATGDDLAGALIPFGPAALLLPQADNARPELATRLRAAHWEVQTVTAYHSVPEPIDLSTLGGYIDAVALSSSATVERFVRAAGPALMATLIADGCGFFAIGPTTAASMKTLGLPITGVAAAPTTAGLATCLTKHLGPTPAPAS